MFTKYLHDKAFDHSIGPTQKKILFFFMKARVFSVVSRVKIKYKIILQPII